MATRADPAGVRLAAPRGRLVDEAQRLACEVLRPGDPAVDLTAGAGRDTLALWRRVAPGGRVWACDIQPRALAAAGELLRNEGVPVHPAGSGQKGAAAAPGVIPVAACHSLLAEWLDVRPRAVLANLGYLPGGPRQIVTCPATTIAALEAAAALLQPGGRLVVVAYPGHPGGAEEAHAVLDWFGRLPRQGWEVRGLEVADRPRAPRLRMAQKLPEEDDTKT